VLLHAPQIYGNGSIDVRGGRQQLANGGVVKLFNCPAAPTWSGGILAGAVQTAKLNIQPPAITQHPAGVQARLGQQACFTVTADRATTYQWTKNGVAIPGATGPQHCIPAVTAADEGSYAVIVGNSCSVDVEVSQAAALQVQRDVTLGGVVWEDRNRNGVRDGLIIGSRPAVVFALDRSGSTSQAFGGTAVGDQNGDGQANTVLDAELAALAALNQSLIERGLGTNAQIALIAFDNQWRSTPFGPPALDANANGVPDIVEEARRLRYGGGTAFSAPLLQARTMLDGLGISPGNGNIIFLTDGFPDPAEPNLGTVAATVRAGGYNLRAFGAVIAGTTTQQRATQKQYLDLLDPASLQFETTDALLGAFSGVGTPGGSPGEPVLRGVRVFLDLNADGVLQPAEPSAITGDEAGGQNYRLTATGLPAGTYQIRVVRPPGRVQTFPAGDAPQTFVYDGVAGEVTGRSFGLATALCVITALEPAAGQAFTAAGGTNAVSITADAADCEWSALASDLWISFPGGATGRGSGSLAFAVAPNTGAARSATITVGARSVTVQQQAFVPLPPTLLPARDIRARRFTAVWEASTAAVGYRMDVATASTFTNPVAGYANLDLGNATSRVVTALSPGTAYFFRLRAYNAHGISGHSATGMVTTLACAVTGLTPATVSFGPTGGTNGVEVTVNDAECPWTAGTAVDWITFPNGTGGTGSGRLACRVAPNLGAARSATIAVGGRTVTVTQEAAAVRDCFVLRRLPGYVAGGVLAVTLQATPPAGTAAYGIEERPPAGWTVEQVSDGGEFDAVNGKVKWTFLDGALRTLTYRLRVPAGASGRHLFSGIANLDGIAECDIGGDQETAPVALHPADVNPADWSLGLAEVLRYATAYRKGETWSAPPVPIDLGYVIRGFTLYKRGERYELDPGVPAPPAWWVSLARTGSVSRLASVAVTAAESAVRALPDTYQPGQPFTASIAISPGTDVVAYGVEETPPNGWGVDQVSEGGEFDAANGKVKWTFLDGQTRTVSYRVTPPGQATGSGEFIGKANFNGERETAVQGAGSIAASGTPQPSLQAALYAGILVTGEVGGSYAIEATADVAGTGGWVELARITLAESPQLFIDEDSPATRWRFFRARRLP
jgi:hypothetical protein